jgi:hypothetical protein
MADRLCREPTRPVQIQALQKRAAVIGSWFADFIRASGRVSATSKGRIHDRTRPVRRQKNPLRIEERPYMELAWVQRADPSGIMTSASAP